MKKSDRSGGSKSPKDPMSVGEEYIVTIEEMGKEGTGARPKGPVILVSNINPGDKVMIRITKLTRSYAVAEVISNGGI